VLTLLTDVRERWTVPDGRILGHSDVAPDRKEDPGELFPWKRLAEAATASGPNRRRLRDPRLRWTIRDRACSPCRGAAPARVRRQADGTFAAEDATIVTAFQRHWRQARVDGIADGETRARLVAVLRAAQAVA
jgi:N-acetylmuramoyl-L-alanine amidase